MMSEVTRYDLTESCDTGEIDITPVPPNFEGRFVSWEDFAAFKAEFENWSNQCAALIKERDALAAENLSLLNMVSNWPKEQCPTTGNVTDVQPADFIPATDAYANQLRAEGVEMLRDEFKKHDAQLTIRCDWFIAHLLRATTAANLRKGD